MNIILNILIALAMVAFIAYFATAALGNIISLRTKSKHAAAEARMLDEIGRKLAGGDATIIAPNGACDSPYCPVHGKAGQN